MGKLYFNYGTMNSSKTANLLMVAHNYESQGRRILCLKPSSDTRWNGEDGRGQIVSRAIEKPLDCFLVSEEENLFELKNETDKIILGQHFIYNDNKSELLIFRRHNFSDKELLRYAEYIKLAVEKNIPDIIAHPDLFMLGRNKFGDVEKQVSNIICSVAEQYGVPLEINLSDPNLYLLGEKDKIEYPCKEVWKIASEYKNLKVIYGVDAHFEYQIMNYEKAIEVANKHIGQDVIDKLHFCNKRLDIEWENQYIDNYIKIKNERSEAIGDKNE